MLFSTVQYLNFKKPNSIIYRTQTSVICFIVFAHKIEQRTVDMFLWNNSGSYWETSSGDIQCFCKWEIGPFSFRILWVYILKLWGEVWVDGFLSTAGVDSPLLKKQCGGGVEVWKVLQLTLKRSWSWSRWCARYDLCTQHSLLVTLTKTAGRNKTDSVCCGFLSCSTWLGLMWPWVHQWEVGKML